MRPEEKIHFAICDYLRLQYPKVMFISESSGVRTSIGLASKLKKTRSNHVHADLYVLQPVGKWSGLVLELKAKTIFKKDGSLLKNDHIEDQFETLQTLRKIGYYASFACGFDEAKEIVDNYLHGNY